MCKRIQEHYLAYAEHGVQCLTTEDKASNHHINNDYDFVYDGINAKFLKAYITSVKTKQNRKHCSYMNIWKYNDAVIFGAEEAKQSLTDQDYDEMNTSLDSCKKECVDKNRQDILMKTKQILLVSFFILIYASGP